MCGCTSTLPHFFRVLWISKNEVNFNCNLTLTTNSLNRVWGRISLLFNGYRGSFLRIKWLEHQPDHSHSFRAEGTNEWTYTSIVPTPSYRGKGQLYLLPLRVIQADLKAVDSRKIIELVTGSISTRTSFGLVTILTQLPWSNSSRLGVQIQTKHNLKVRSEYFCWQ